jgi:prepilin-type N-terminal cleavage/methylation domain-containing protein
MLHQPLLKSRPQRGFTLIEMSVVLMIIGAIVGAIMFGRSLVTVSRLQTVITDMDNYTTATNNFKQTYEALPGDFNNADTIFGPDSNGCPSGMYTTGLTGAHTGTGGGTTGTCNGNGNGQLIAATAASTPGETFLFWQHLYYAKMINQSVSNQAGPAGSGYYDSLVGKNVPSGSMKGSGFSMIWIGRPGVTTPAYCTTSNCFAGSYGNALIFGNQVTGSPSWGPILTPDQAASIDNKIDDGFPGTGSVRAMLSTSTITPKCTVANASNANCATATTSPGCYNVGTTTTTPLCSLIFVEGF